ncbi:MAG: DNA recombination protein RmuC [Desulfuromonadaceae bacterium]|nr:DNA recombination protein RmuC [Desulfuromonadaceae bacterium]
MATSQTQLRQERDDRQQRLDAQLTLLEDNRAELARVQQEHARLQGETDQLRRQLEAGFLQREQQEQSLTAARLELEQRAEQNARLQTRLTEQQQQNEEKLQLLERAREQLRDQFKSLAQEILEEKGKRFTEHNSAGLQAILTPFRDQLQDFKKKVDDVYTNDVRERASLKQELENLRRLNQQINEEATNLTRALKGDHKVQGNWGELVLERVLEQSGLRRGSEYDCQGGFRDADQRLLKPDVIVHLPEDKDIIIDSKVSLVAYERYCNEEEPQQREQALRDHVAAVRQHITGLSEKDYTALKGVRSLDFVLMFMPVEAAFMAAFQADEGLFNHAFAKRIVVVTPTTLLATLRTVENIWRYERQNQNAQAIAERAGAVYDKLRGFIEDMEKLGAQLSTLDQTYHGAMNKLCQGRGNLVSQASRFVDLGVKVRKPLPKTVLERAELEGGTDSDEPEVDDSES